jgi:hypothetical protein
MDEFCVWKSRYIYERNLPADFISAAKPCCVQNCDQIPNTCR